MKFTDQLIAGKMEDVRLIDEASRGMEIIDKLRREVRLLERGILVAMKNGEETEADRQELANAERSKERAEEELTVLTSEIGRRVLMGNLEIANIANAELEREFEEMSQS